MDRRNRSKSINNQINYYIIINIMLQQLVKKDSDGRYSNVMPKSWIEAIKDKNTGQTLVEINVKRFEGILIHAGNSSKDSAGCLLVEINKVKGQVLNSREIFKELYKLLKDKHDKGGKITIKIL